jgi:hypothetical protein
MFWESDRDERLNSEMYGTTRLYVSRLDIPDPDAENKSDYKPDYLAEGSLDPASVTLGDMFTSVDEIDSEFASADLQSPPVSGIVADSLESSAPAVAAVSVDMPIGDMYSTPESLDASFGGAPPVADSVVSMPTLSEAPTASLDMPVQVPTLDSVADSLQVPVAAPESAPEPPGLPPEYAKMAKVLNAETVLDSRESSTVHPGWGAPPDAPFGPSVTGPSSTASPYHALRGNFGGKPITQGGVPDMRFTSRLTDGGEMGGAIVAAESSSTMYLNNLTQLLATMSEVLLDHAQKIRDIEEIIERSC